METKRVYTKATERLKRLHNEYGGLKSGKPGDAVFFSNTDVDDNTGNFSADGVGSGYFTRRAYEEVSEEEFIRFMALGDVKDVFNPQKHYDNSNGSLYKVATERKWNAYIFDVVKRLERGGKKDPLRQEIEKSIDVLKIWLAELESK